MADVHIRHDADSVEILSQVRALVAGVNTVSSILANVSSLLFWSMRDINWAGFYLLHGDTLYLGPFHGRPACVVIPFGRGVCGTAVARRETIVVPDVDAFPGHIACDSASRSEIVIPLIEKGRIIGVLDVDSPVPDRFNESDRELLEDVVEAVVAALTRGDLQVSGLVP